MKTYNTPVPTTNLHGKALSFTIKEIMHMA